MARYWETEDPIEVKTGRFILRWYPRAKRFVFEHPGWIDPSDGFEFRTRRVILNAFYLGQLEADNRRDVVDIFCKMLTCIDDALIITRKEGD